MIDQCEYICLALIPKHLGGHGYGGGNDALLQDCALPLLADHFDDVRLLFNACSNLLGLRTYRILVPDLSLLKIVKQGFNLVGT